MNSLIFLNKNISRTPINGENLGPSNIDTQVNDDFISERNAMLKSILRVVTFFLVAFIAITLILNAFSWFSGIGDNINAKMNQQSENERLTELYRKQYGYGSGYSDTGFNYINPNEIQVANIGTTVTNEVVNTPVVVNNSGTANMAGNYIYIPKLNIKAPIITTPSTDSRVLLASLSGGVLVYPGSAMPGMSGSTVIVGHSSSNSISAKYGKVFAGLNRLVGGDQIFIHYSDKDYIYTITGKNTGSVTELATLGLSDDLILGTCWPIGTDQERIVVSATLQHN